MRLVASDTIEKKEKKTITAKQNMTMDRTASGFVTKNGCLHFFSFVPCLHT